MLLVSIIFLLDFGTVLTVWYFLFFILCQLYLDCQTYWIRK